MHELNHEIIKKYNKTGPRYTSYPTAIQFNKHFDINEYKKNTKISVLNSKSLSFYIHIPFCSNICYYCACNKIVTKDVSRAEEYLTYLMQEIEIHATHYDKNQIIEQLHFGGGTPTFLNNSQIQSIINKIGKYFNLSECNDRDYSIEIDPRTVNSQSITELKKIGFNRISIGVQDLNEKVQKAINRIQPEKQVRSVVNSAKKMAFKSIHMDLIYGLPYQNAASFLNTLKIIINMNPDRISLFNYAHIPHKFKTQRGIKEDDLPSPEEKLTILTQAASYLIDNGYVYIGMDHFTLPKDELLIAREKGFLQRNFQGYTTHNHCDLIGIGLSSISKVENVYIQNTTDEQIYKQIIANGDLPISKGLKMSDDDKIRAAVINKLICYFKLDFSYIEKKFNINFCQYFAKELVSILKFVDDGLLIIEKNQMIEITKLGRFLIRNICMEFDVYLNDIPTKNLYSKVI